LVVPIGLLLIASEGYGQMGGMMGGSMIRHHFAMMNGIGVYAQMANPLPSTAENLAQGKGLYERNCARCHGAAGLGDGEEGKGLVPPPANIAASTKMPMAPTAISSGLSRKGEHLWEPACRRSRTH
jgi:mono/diheme cytochrome c family protein